MKPEIINSVGLIIDVLGFILISKDIVMPREPTEGEVTEFADAFGERIGTLTNLKYFQPTKWSKIGFCLIILGFLIQLLGNIVSYINSN